MKVLVKKSTAREQRENNARSSENNARTTREQRENKWRTRREQRENNARITRELVRYARDNRSCDRKPSENTKRVDSTQCESHTPRYVRPRRPRPVIIHNAIATRTLSPRRNHPGRSIAAAGRTMLMPCRRSANVLLPLPPPLVRATGDRREIDGRRIPSIDTERQKR